MKAKIIKSPDLALKRIESLSKQLSAKANGVLIGLPRNSNAYPDGTSVIMVGSVHEFGSPLRNIPQRSFLRSTISDNRKEYRQDMRVLTQQIFNLKLTKAQALGKMGLKVQGDVQQRIVDIKEPALKRVRKDGSSNPLNDTGHLKQSITFIVDDR